MSKPRLRVVSIEEAVRIALEGQARKRDADRAARAVVQAEANVEAGARLAGDAIQQARLNATLTRVLRK